MKTCTVSEAKSKLGELADAAIEGEPTVIVRVVLVAITAFAVMAWGDYPQPLEDTPPEEAERGVIALEFRGEGSEKRPYIVGTATPLKEFWVQCSTNLIEWKTLGGAITGYDGYLQIALLGEYPPMRFFRLMAVE